MTLNLSKFPVYAQLLTQNQVIYMVNLEYYLSDLESYLSFVVSNAAPVYNRVILPYLYGVYHQS